MKALRVPVLLFSGLMLSVYLLTSSYHYWNTGIVDFTMAKSGVRHYAEFATDRNAFIGWLTFFVSAGVIFLVSSLAVLALYIASPEYREKLINIINTPNLVIILCLVISIGYFSYLASRLAK